MDFTLADPALFDGITPGTAARFEFRQGAPGEFVITRIERLPEGTASRAPSASRAGTDRHEGH
jgi:Cu(I)/Ag(I) efflux system membrane fusion protein